MLIKACHKIDMEETVLEAKSEGIRRKQKRKKGGQLKKTINNLLANSPGNY